MHSKPRPRYTVYDTPLFFLPGQVVDTPTYKLTRILLAVYVGLDLALLGIGITFTALSLVWMKGGLVQGMVLTQRDLISVFALGGLFIATFFVSLPSLVHAFTLPPKREFSSNSFTFLNAILCLDQAVIIGVGVIIWWRTLQERATFFQYWEGYDEDFRNFLQAKFDCCGYFTQCSSLEGTPALPVCVDPVTAYADKIMNILFTSIFATSAIVLLLLLCSGCIIMELRVLNRHRKIDIKRGTLSLV
ncbi:hypothetical protein M0805_006425 [Coniferiporia weirii]|nr:hypothetical protein M0805_006425 [Coniferiporia weirii]